MREDRSQVPLSGHRKTALAPGDGCENRPEDGPQSESFEILLSGCREPAPAPGNGCGNGPEDGPQSEFSDALSNDVAAVVLLLSLASLFYARALITGRLAVGGNGGDAALQFYPWHHFAAQQIRQGQLPFWDPYVFGGHPFLANPQTRLFYPLNLVSFLLPTGVALNLSVVIHVFLAGTFTYLYARHLGLARLSALVSAVVFMFSGFFVAHIWAGHINIVQTGAWLPLVFLLSHRAWTGGNWGQVALAGIAISLMILAGFPQLSYLVLVALTLYFVCTLLTQRPRDLRRVGVGGLRFAAMVGLGLLLSAVQLLPTSELVGLSTRAGGVSFAFVAARNSLPPWGLISFVIPDLFGNPVADSYWGHSWGLWHELNGYVGLLPLGLAALAVVNRWRNTHVRFFAILAGGALLLSLGKYTPLYYLFYRFVFGYDLFRIPAQHLLLFSFAACVLAGFGVDRLSGLSADRGGRVALVYLLLAALLLCGWLIGRAFRAQLISVLRHGLEFAYRSGMLKLLGIWQQHPPMHYVSRVSAVQETVTRSLLLPSLNAVLAALALWLGARGISQLQWRHKAEFLDRLGQRLRSFKSRRLNVLQFRYRDTLLIGVVVIDLWSFGLRYSYRPLEFSSSEQRGRILRYLGSDEDLFRVAVLEPWATPNPILNPNFGSVFSLFYVNGGDPLILRRYAEFFNRIENRPRGSFESVRVPFSNYESNLLDLLNVKYLLTTQRLRSAKFKLVLDGDIRVYENRRFIPRAYIVRDVAFADSPSEALRQFDQVARSPMDSAVIEGQPVAFGGNRAEWRGALQDQVVIRRYAPNQIQMEASLVDDGFLILSEIYYPGWRALVDGVNQRLLRANYIFRAVPLRAGTHTVTLHYTPGLFRRGLILSGIGVLLAGGLIRYSRGGELDDYGEIA